MLHWVWPKQTKTKQQQQKAQWKTNKPGSSAGLSRSCRSAQLPHHMSLSSLFAGLQSHLAFLCSCSGEHSCLGAFVPTSPYVKALPPGVPPSFHQTSVQSLPLGGTHPNCPHLSALSSLLSVIYFTFIPTWYCSVHLGFDFWNCLLYDQNVSTMRTESFLRCSSLLPCASSWHRVSIQ